MPIYEYACHGCGDEFEMLLRSSTVPACPKCQSKDLEKMLSVFAPSVSGSASEAAMAAPMGPCGTCGHPDGPGACKFN